MVLRKREDTGNERRSTGSHSVANLIWKRLWTCRKKTVKEHLSMHKTVDKLIYKLSGEKT
jgi:hypothetical protein